MRSTPKRGFDNLQNFVMSANFSRSSFFVPPQYESETPKSATLTTENGRKLDASSSNQKALIAICRSINAVAIKVARTPIAKPDSTATRRIANIRPKNWTAFAEELIEKMRVQTARSTQSGQDTKKRE